MRSSNFRLVPFGIEAEQPVLHHAGRREHPVHPLLRAARAVRALAAGPELGGAAAVQPQKSAGVVLEPGDEPRPDATMPAGST